MGVETDQLRGTGVTWEGSLTSMEEIQHLLFDFDVAIGQHGFQLLIIFKGGDPVEVSIGDEVVINDFDQFAVLRAPTH